MDVGATLTAETVPIAAEAARAREVMMNVPLRRNILGINYDQIMINAKRAQW